MRPFLTRLLRSVLAPFRLHVRSDVGPGRSQFLTGFGSAGVDAALSVVTCRSITRV